MNDQTQASGNSAVPDDEDPLQINSIISEALVVASQAKEYEAYVTQYTGAAAQEWAQTMQAFQAEMEGCCCEPTAF